MKAISYLIWRNIIGIIRNFKKKKGQLVLIVFMFVIFGVLLFANTQMDDINQWIPNEYIPAAFAAIVIFVSAFTINNGLKKGSSSYRKADINFVFPSPISPKLILIYGFLKQLAISILIALWFIFQSVTIRNLFGFTVNGFYIFLLATFIVVLYMPVSSMWLYSITLRKQGAKRVLSRIYLGIGIIFAAAIIALTIYKSDPLWAVNVLIGNNYFEYIPVLGWLVTLLKAAKFGFTYWTWTALALLVLGLVFILWRLLSSEIPFYEEVLKKTDEKESLIKAKRSGNTNLNLSSKKTRKEKITYKGTGASALFYRQILEYKKVGFLFIDKITIIMLVAGVVGGFILSNFNVNVSISLYFAIYLNFLFAFSGKWVHEFKNTLIYLMPGTALSKLWYATAANHIKHFIDGIAVFIPIFIILKLDIIMCIGYILAYTAIGAIYIYAEVLSRRLFGRMYKGNISNIFKMICIFVILIPAIVGFILLNNIFKQSIMVLRLAPLVIVIYSSIVSFLIMLLGKRMFKDIELM